MQLFASALFGFSLLAASIAPAAAQQVQPAASTAPTTTTTTTTNQNVAAPAGQPDFSEFVASANDMPGTIAKVRAMNGASANNIRPVNVSTLSGSDAATLSSTVTRNQAHLNALRNALGHVTVTTMTNERISVAQFLADNKIGINQVVGADVNNGTLVLFYQKP